MVFQGVRDVNSRTSQWHVESSLARLDHIKFAICVVPDPLQGGFLEIPWERGVTLPQISKKSVNRN